MTSEEFKEHTLSLSKEQLKRYIETIDVGDEYDYTINYYGHHFEALDHQIGEFIFRAQIFSSKKLVEGDIILANAQSGNIGKYMILNLSRMKNPSNQYFAWVACIGHKK